MTRQQPATADRNALRDRCSGLPGQDDIELGAALLAEVATHENRPPSLLRAWAAAATEFGATLADPAAGVDIDRLAADAGLSVRQCAGGVTASQLTLAQYASRPPSIILFDDAIRAAERLIDELGWRDWFPAGCVRDVAICHEVVHRVLHGPTGAALKKHLNHVLVHCGPITVRGHVLGADELVAHSYARVMCRLPRSPLLLTAALGAAADLLIYSGKEA